MTHWLTHFVDESHKRLVYVTLPTVYSQDDTNPSLTPYTELLESATHSSSIQSPGVKDFKSRTTVTSRNISRTLFLSFEKNISRFMALLNKSHKKPEVTSQVLQEQVRTETFQTRDISPSQPLFVFNHKQKYLDRKEDLLVGQIKFDMR